MWCDGNMTAAVVYFVLFGLSRLICNQVFHQWASRPFWEYVAAVMAVRWSLCNYVVWGLVSLHNTLDKVCSTSWNKKSVLLLEIMSVKVVSDRIQVRDTFKELTSLLKRTTQNKKKDFIEHSNVFLLRPLLPRHKTHHYHYLKKHEASL